MDFRNVGTCETGQIEFEEVVGHNFSEKRALQVSEIERSVDMIENQLKNTNNNRIWLFSQRTNNDLSMKIYSNNILFLFD